MLIFEDKHYLSIDMNELEILDKSDAFDFNCYVARIPLDKETSECITFNVYAQPSTEAAPKTWIYPFNSFCLSKNTLYILCEDQLITLSETTWDKKIDMFIKVFRPLY